MAKLNTIMVTISERLEGIEDKFTKIMMRAVHYKAGSGNDNPHRDDGIAFHAFRCFWTYNNAIFKVGFFSHNLFYYAGNSCKVCGSWDRFDIDSNVNKRFNLCRFKNRIKEIL